MKIVNKQNGDKIDSIIKVTKFDDLYKLNLDSEPDSIKIKYDSLFQFHMRSLTNEEAKKWIELPKYVRLYSRDRKEFSMIHELMEWKKRNL